MKKKIMALGALLASALLLSSCGGNTATTVNTAEGTDAESTATERNAFEEVTTVIGE